MTTETKNTSTPQSSVSPLARWEGRVIPFSKIACLPKRIQYLDQKAIERQDAVMREGKALNFLPVNVYEGYLPEDDRGQFTPGNQYSTRMYKIFLFGVLRCGRNVTVILNGILPYFEVRVPDGNDPKAFETRIRDLLSSKQIRIRETRITSGSTFREYGDKPSMIQVYFTSTYNRKQAINAVRDIGMETFHDDQTGYYKVVTRDVMSTVTNWTVLENYKVKRDHKWTNTDITINVHYKDWKMYTGDILLDPELKNDKSVNATWDIETDDPAAEEKGDVPRPESQTFNMFNIGVNFSYIDSDIMPADDNQPVVVDAKGNAIASAPTDTRFSYTKPAGYLAMFTITTDVCRARPGRVTILVSNHVEAIQAYGILMNLMKPQHIIDFNGSNYDWICLVYLAWLLGQLQFLERNMSHLNLAAFLAYEGKHWVRPVGITKYYWFQKYVCKLGPDNNVDGRTLSYPGYQCVDMMTQLRAINNNPEKYSLNVFLKMYKLSSKIDMPYLRMFAIHRLTKEIMQRSGAYRHAPSLREPICREYMRLIGMAREYNDLLGWNSDINEYCSHDAAKCQDLTLKSVYIRDRREIGQLSYTSLEDCVNRANGMKVRNLAIGRAATRGIHISNIAPEKVEAGQYPGALVIDPKKGIKAPRISPAIAWDEAKAQNHLYAEYLGMTPEMLRGFQDFIWENGIHWHRLSMAAKARAQELFPQWLVNWFKISHYYPIGGLDFASLYPSLIMAYNYSPEMMVHDMKKAMALASRGKRINAVSFPFNGRTVKGWSVRHSYRECDCKFCIVGKPTAACLEENTRRMNDPGVEFGVFATILKELFDARVVIKGKLKPHAKRKEEIELLPPVEFNRPEIQAEYADVCFAYNYYNSKQKALKIYMNTFYGESGNARSPLRVLAVAGGITSSGQYNLRLGMRVLEGMGNEVHYGDTDSLYNSANAEKFDLPDREYYSGRITLTEYMEKIVTIAFVEIEIARKAVNRAYIEDNGTNFLSMAYEELLYPTILFKKKFYVGIEHIGHFNRNPKKPFARGGDAVKKGVSALVKEASDSTVWRMLDPTNHVDPVTLVTRKIQEIFTTQHDFRKFVKTATYKPLKQNVSVQVFAKIMRERGTPLEPLARFSYVIVKKPQFVYDVRGRKRTLSIGERMELAEVAERDKLQIDMPYYVEKNLVNIMSSFIAFLPQFTVSVRSGDDYDEAEAKSMKAATAYVTSLCDKYNEKPKSQGPMYQQLFRHLNGVFSSRFAEIGSGSSGQNGDVMQMVWTEVKEPRGKKPDHKEKFAENGEIFDLIVEKIDSSAAKEANADAKQIFAKLKAGAHGGAQSGAHQAVQYERMMEYKKAYTSLLAERKDRFTTERTRMLTLLRQNSNALNGLIQKRNAVLEECTSHIRQGLDLDNREFEEKNWVSKYVDQDKLGKLMQYTIVKKWGKQDIRMLNHIQRLANQLRALYKLTHCTQALLNLISTHVRMMCGDVSVKLKSSEIEKEALEYYRNT